MHLGTHVIFVLRGGARGSSRGARITREFPGAMFDRITSDLEGREHRRNMRDALLTRRNFAGRANELRGSILSGAIRR